jgi:hypothetical protein
VSSGTTGKQVVRNGWNRRIFPRVIKRLTKWGRAMGPGYFVIAILGCADGGSGCTPVATLPVHYATEEECSAASAPALEANSNFDFPTLLARCRPEAPHASADAERASADVQRERPVPSVSRRG